MIHLHTIPIADSPSALVPEGYSLVDGSKWEIRDEDDSTISEAAINSDMTVHVAASSGNSLKRLLRAQLQEAGLIQQAFQSDDDDLPTYHLHMLIKKDDEPGNIDPGTNEGNDDSQEGQEGNPDDEDNNDDGDKDKVTDFPTTADEPINGVDTTDIDKFKEKNSKKKVKKSSKHKKSKPKKSNAPVRTGDPTGIGLFAALMALLTSTLTILTLWRKKKTS